MKRIRSFLVILLSAAIFAGCTLSNSSKAKVNVSLPDFSSSRILEDGTLEPGECRLTFTCKEDQSLNTVEILNGSKNSVSVEVDQGTWKIKVELVSPDEVSYLGESEEFYAEAGKEINVTIKVKREMPEDILENVTLIKISASFSPENSEETALTARNYTYESIKNSVKVVEVYKDESGQEHEYETTDFDMDFTNFFNANGGCNNVIGQVPLTVMSTKNQDLRDTIIIPVELKKESFGKPALLRDGMAVGNSLSVDEGTPLSLNFTLNGSTGYFSDQWQVFVTDENGGLTSFMKSEECRANWYVNNTVFDGEEIEISSSLLLSLQVSIIVNGKSVDLEYYECAIRIIDSDSVTELTGGPFTTAAALSADQVLTSTVEVSTEGTEIFKNNISGSVTISRDATLTTVPMIELKEEAATLTISEGIILNGDNPQNTAPQIPAILVSNGTLTLCGGAVIQNSKNIQNDISGQSGTIHATGSDSFVVLNGVVFQDNSNSVTYNGTTTLTGSVTVQNGATVTLNGECVIDGIYYNNKTDLCPSIQVKNGFVNKNEASGAKVPVSIVIAEFIPKADGKMDLLTIEDGFTDLSSFEVTDLEGNKYSLDESGKIEKIVDNPVVTVLSQETFNEDGTITLSNNYTVEETIEISKNIVITSDSKKITRAETFTNGPMFKVLESGSLTVEGTTLDGGCEDLCVTGMEAIIPETCLKATDGPIIYNVGGTVKLGTNAILQNNYMVYSSTCYGGGAVFSAGGTVEIDGAKIQNNRCDAFDKTGLGGGGIAVMKGALTIKSGEISNNSSSKNGGGVAVFSTSEAIGYGEIEFTMEDGIISNNVAAVSGGGISIYGKKSTTGEKITSKLISGSVESNYLTAEGNSSYFGAGVFYAAANTDSNLEIGSTEKEFEIKNNINNAGAAVNGINLYLSGPTKTTNSTNATLVNAIISGANATKATNSIKGAGVYVTNINLEVSGGSIKDNHLSVEETPTVSGIGMYIGAANDYATVIFNGGNISNNTVTSSTGTINCNSTSIYLNSKSVTFGGTSLETISTETAFDADIENGIYQGTLD